MPGELATNLRKEVMTSSECVRQAGDLPKLQCRRFCPRLKMQRLYSVKTTSPSCIAWTMLPTSPAQRTAATLPSAAATTETFT